MNRLFYSLPDPREVGLKCKQFEKARQKVERIEERYQEAQRRRAKVEEEIRSLGDAEIEELKRAVLEGTDDPGAKHDEHEALVEKLRELGRQVQALSQALPVAEEELRLTVFEYQHRWKEEADTV